MWILKSELLEHGFALLRLVSVSQTTKISLFEQKCTQTDRQTSDTIHTSLSLTLSVDREHNSPSGNKGLHRFLDASEGFM